MDFKQKLESYKVQVENTLKQFLEKHRPNKNMDEVDIELYEILTEFTLRGGKRVRPILLKCAYDIGRNDNFTDNDAIWIASCSVEFMQSYLLIHDDIMDQSDQRRGDDTVHKRYETLYKKSLDHSELFALSAAIIAGNFANHLGSLALIESDFDSSRKIAALEEYNKIPMNVGYGQIIDMILPFRTKVTFGDLEQVYFLKTSAYSTTGPMRVGARLANASDELFELLVQLGNSMGQMFQIQDDIIGLFGSGKETGKSPKSDIEEGKKTILVVHAQQNGTDVQAEHINKILGRTTITDDELDQVRTIIEDTGSLEYARTKVRELSDISFKTLDTLHEYSDVSDTLDFISGLVEYIGNRNT